MIPVSDDFLAEVGGDNRNFVYYIDANLADTTVLHLSNDDLWQGGVAVEDAISDETSLAVGSAIINQCTIILNNINEQFNSHEFKDARIVLRIGLMVDGAIEAFQKGEFSVDDVMYDGSLITLTCLDNMRKFDKPYTPGIQYPNTLHNIVVDACRQCDVALVAPAVEMPMWESTIPEIVFEQSLTFRDIIAWAAQINGTNARINRFGELEFMWYDLASLYVDEALIRPTTEPEYLEEDSTNESYVSVIKTQNNIGILLDYPVFNYLKALYTINVARMDTYITGVKVIVQNDNADDAALNEYTVGTDEYMIVIQNNKFITTDNAQDVANAVAEKVVGMRYRKATYSHIGYPTMEAGDVAFIFDGKDRLYRTIVSSTTFISGDRQTTVSSSETPVENVASRYTESTKNYVRSKETIKKTFDSLTERIQNSSGLYTTEMPDGQGGTIYYLHDKPNLSSSLIIWKMTAEAWGVSTDGGLTYKYGMTVDGDTIVRILSAEGVNADWIDSGAFRIYDTDGETILFLADRSNHSFEWHMSKSDLSSQGKLTLHSGSYNDGTEQAAGVAVDLLAEAQTVGYEEKAFLYANGMRFRNQHSTGGVEDYHYQTNIRPGSAYFENNEDGTHGTQIGGSGLSTTDDVSFGGFLYHNYANAGTSLELVSAINHLWKASMPRIVVPRYPGKTATVDISRFRTATTFAALVAVWNWTTSPASSFSLWAFGGLQGGLYEGVHPIYQSSFGGSVSISGSTLTITFYNTDGGGYAILPLIYAADDQLGNLPYV